MFTREDLIAIFPPPRPGTSARGIWEAYVQALLSYEGTELLRRYEITTPLRLIHLFGTFGAENGLRLVWESGAYTPERLVAIFGPGRHSARITLDEARGLCAKTGSVNMGGRVAPAKEFAIFERVYGLGNPKKAKELGNTQPGDGWAHRGFGLNQLTGAEAHRRAAAEIGCTVEDLWANPLFMVHAALIEWKAKNCNRYADADDVVSVRKLVNAGTLKIAISAINGLPEARAAVARAKRVITPEDFETPASSAVARPDAPPASMAWSTEGQVQTLIGGTGGAAGAKTLMAGIQAAVKTMFTKGTVTISGFFACLVEQDDVWTGLGLILLFAGGATYLWLKRRRKLYLHGV